MCVCTNIPMYVCTNIPTYVCMYIRMTYVCTHMYRWMYIRTGTHTYVWMYVHTRTHTYVCMYVHTHTHTHKVVKCIAMPVRGILSLACYFILFLLFSFFSFFLILCLRRSSLVIKQCLNSTVWL